jgi:hypothetical protein
MLRCSFGCCCCGSILVGIVIVGDGVVIRILWVVATVVGGVELCSNIVMMCVGVGMGCGFVCVVEEWGVGVRIIVGLCMSVVVIFAAGVCVAEGAASFLGACQKKCGVYPVLHPSPYGCPG